MINFRENDRLFDDSSFLDGNHSSRHVHILEIEASFYWKTLMLIFFTWPIEL